MTDVSAPSDPAGPTCVLVLQGGGALGAYHIGAYEALVERGFTPDWICGISIGAINAAVIAGNPPVRRLERLAALWESISWPAFAPIVQMTFPWLVNTMVNAEAFVSASRISSCRGRSIPISHRRGLTRPVSTTRAP